jgi:PAS domain S-box-containing protein/putative nucleotidyltransferase with HDIG domain
MLTRVLRWLVSYRGRQAPPRLVRKALDTAANAVVITDSQGRVVWVNPAFTRLTGYEAGEILGRTPRLLRSGRQDAAYYARLWATIRAGQTWHGTLVNRRKDGTLYHEEQTITPVGDRRGRVTHFIAIKQDVTAQVERARAQEALATLAAALRRAEARPALLATMVEQTCGLLGAAAVALGRCDLPAAELVYEAAVGAWSAVIDTRAALEGTASSQVVARSERYQTADLRSDPLLDAPLGLPLPLAAMGVPLRARDTVIGVLWVARDRPFTPAEAQLLEALADLASAAIHRTELHEQTQQQLRQLQSLRTIDLTISASLSLQVTLGIVVEQVRAQLGVDAAAVLLADPYDHTLAYAAGDGFRTLLVRQLRVRLGEGLVGQAALDQRPVQLSVVPTAEGGYVRGALLATEGFVGYAAMPLVVKGQLLGLLEVFQRRPLRCDAAWYAFLEALAGQTAIAVEHSALFTRLQRSHTELLLAYDTTLEGWARALELRDNETQGHSRRVTALTVRLARALGVSDDHVTHMRRGALLHDIGKMGVPDAILRKPGPLDEAEWAVMRRHPEDAVTLLAPIAFLQPALDIPQYHHERWDGSGYPRGLRGAQIPLAARIFAVVDVWDALTNDRPYRAAVPPAEARAYLQAQAGLLFDPEVVAALLRVLDDEGVEEPAPR